MHTNQFTRMARGCGLLATIALAPAASYGQVVAGTLQVNLNAASYAGGNWTNTGALGGTLVPSGIPTTQNIGGAAAVIFDGSDAFRGPVIPSSMTGAGTRTIEVWAFQGNARDEETLVAWGRRGGGDSTNESFNWGANREWGAHGGWGSNADLGWNPVPGNNPGSARDTTNMPTVGSWHHLVYTYDGTTMSVYDNGVLKNSQAVPLSTHDGYQLVIGSQNANVAAPGGDTGDNIHFSGAIGQVRVHDGVLSATDILSNYNLEVGNYNAPVGAPLTAAPAHRYTFNNLSSGSAGTVVPDVIGGANAVIRGGGATITPVGLDLPGGNSASAAYVDLPNGLVSSRTNITLEAWVTTQGITNWGRVFDFGTGSSGEITDVGGSASGTDYIILSGSVGTGTDQRLERNGGAQPGGLNQSNVRDTVDTVVLNTEFHVALTYDSAKQEWNYYRDSVLMATLPDTDPLSALNDQNNWLGRSNWTGDDNLDGFFNEFRVYNEALTQAQIYGNYLAGPDAVNLVPEPSSAAALSGFGLALLARRRRRS